MTYVDHIAADARLIILKELAAQVDGRLNSAILLQVLDSFGHRKSRDWLHTQLAALEDIGAVAVTQLGTVWVARLTLAGLEHTQRRRILAGVAKPSPVGD